MQNFGQAILTALSNALNLVFTFVPKLIGFLVILLIGWIIATALSKALVFLLRKVGFDRLSARIGLTTLEARMGSRLDPADLLGKIVYWFIFLIFLVPATDALGLSTVTNILNELIAYIPNVFVAVLVLFLGMLAAAFVADIVRGVAASTSIRNANVLAAVARWAIIGFAAIIALEQLQIAQALLNILFTAVIGGLAIALTFAFGSRESARNVIAGYYVRQQFQPGQLLSVDTYTGRLLSVSGAYTTLEIINEAGERSTISLPNATLLKRAVTGRENPPTATGAVPDMQPPPTDDRPNMQTPPQP